MKKIAILLFALILILSMHKQGLAQNNGAHSSDKFSACMRSIKSSQNHQVRYNNATQYFLNEWSTTRQLQDVCYYLPNDELKFQLCMAAYPKIIDKNNFAKIYDSFFTFSYVIRLYHNTQAKDGSLEYEHNPNGGYPSTIPTENDCNTGAEEFSHILTAIKEQTFANAQKRAAKIYIAKKCLSMNQLQQIVSVLTMDGDRLEIIKYLYDYAPFPEKMYAFRKVLTFSVSKKKLDQFLIDKQ